MTNVDIATVVILTLGLTLYALTLLPIRLLLRRIPPLRRRKVLPPVDAPPFPVVPPFDPAFSEDTMPVSFVVTDENDAKRHTRRDLAYALYLDLRSHPDESLAPTPDDLKFQAELEGTHLHLGRAPSDAELQTLALRLADAILALYDERHDENGQVERGLNRTRWIEVTPAALDAQLRLMGIGSLDDHILERAARVALGFQFQRVVSSSSDEKY